ncbi:MAG: N-acetylneuraminate synthase [Lachnospiraceae bacterium]|nr:N-acetylneuraminate synthase [Lachnospiraceae bacterium]
MNRKTLIIAEAGVNHNGSLQLAYKMVDEAKKAGADIIKFQTAKAENMISKFAEKAEYQKQTTDAKESQLDMVRKLMLSFEDFKVLKKYCEKSGIRFLSTPFDLESINFLDELGCDFWKIPSGEITNYPYLCAIAKTHKPVILSTGMSNLQEIEECLQVLHEHGTHDVSLLHCNTQYPTPYEDVNLLAMQTLRERFGVKVGYSDHTQGIEVPIAAVAMGAQIIEKHFTLDRMMEGPDHKASLEPQELCSMVAAIRNIEKAIGSGEKEVSSSEQANLSIARKSIVAKRTIVKGEILTEENITTKRPGNGISPMQWTNVLGKAAIRDFQEDELLEMEGESISQK